MVGIGVSSSLIKNNFQFNTYGCQAGTHFNNMGVEESPNTTQSHSATSHQKTTQPPGKFQRLEN